MSATATKIDSLYKRWLIVVNREKDDKSISSPQQIQNAKIAFQILFLLY